jgi:Methyltransferase small domain
MTPDPVEAWVAALVDRHTRAFTRPEFLKAIRALSARYVERHANLARRPVTDTAGKRAAFAAFYAPLHLLTTRAIVSALGDAIAPVDRVIDLGCGTGAASAGWALTGDARPQIQGVDRDAWSLTEAAWNWRHLGLSGRTSRGDLVRAAEDSASRPPRDRAGRVGFLLGWSANELVTDERQRLFVALMAGLDRGDSVLVIEPIARAALPWWNDWADAFTARGGRADEWKLPPSLPPMLADLDEAAGFRRESLSGRSLLAQGLARGQAFA